MYRIWMFITRLIRITIALVIAGLIIFAVYDHLTDPNRQVYSFDRLHYDVTIEDDGSASVVETREFNYKRGRFTYGWFNLDPAATDIRVYEDGRLYAQLDQLPTKRQPDQFIVLPQNQNLRVEWYYAAQGPETRRFQFHYRMPDVTLAYADCAVYFQKYFTTADTAAVRRIEVTVRLPEGADAGNTLIWGHGPAHGQISFAEDDSSRVLLQVDRIGKDQYVEARFLLPAGSVPGARYTAQPRYEAVLAEETAAAAAADRDRFLLNLLTLLAGLAVLALIIALVRHYRLQRTVFQRLPAEPVAPYLRDIPTQAPLPVVARLFRFYGKKVPDAELISLTILDLVRQNVLQLETVQDGKKQALYLVLRPNGEDNYNVSSHEVPVLDFLFRDAAANSRRISLEQLKRYCRSHKNRAASASLLLSFSGALDSVWNKTGYEDKSRGQLPAALRNHRIACLLGGVLAFVVLFFLSSAIVALPAAILLSGSLLALLANWLLTRKRPYLTRQGENELARWQALARFFRDFANFAEKDLPEIGLWEDLLIYAAALQMADQVQQKLRLRYPDMDNWSWQNHNYHLLYGSYWGRQSTFQQATGLPGLQASLNQIMQQAHSVVHAQSSSSGGGGGFSGGGSSGGGGSGGSSGGGVG